MVIYVTYATSIFATNVDVITTDSTVWDGYIVSRDFESFLSIPPKWATDEKIEEHVRKMKSFNKPKPYHSPCVRRDMMGKSGRWSKSQK